MTNNTLTPGEEKWLFGETPEYAKRQSELDTAIRKMEYWKHRWQHGWYAHTMLDAEERMISYLMRILELRIESHFDLPPVGPELLDSLTHDNNYRRLLKQKVRYHFDYQDYVNDVLDQMEDIFEEIHGVRVPIWYEEKDVRLEASK